MLLAATAAHGRSSVQEVGYAGPLGFMEDADCTACGFSGGGTAAMELCVREYDCVLPPLENDVVGVKHEEVAVGGKEQGECGFEYVHGFRSVEKYRDGQIYEELFVVDGKVGGNLGELCGVFKVDETFVGPLFIADLGKDIFEVRCVENAKVKRF